MTHTPTERLALLYRLSQTFNSSLDLNRVLDQVMDEVITAVHGERGFLMLYDDQGQLVFRAARGIHQQAIEAPEFQISRGLVERVAREGQATVTSDAQNDQWLGTRPSVVNLRLRSILCVPLQLKEKTIGVIYVDNRWHIGIFTADDLELLKAIASSAAIAIENARLYEVAVEKGRLERELQLARAVQVSLLPRDTPEIPGWEFATHWQPARQVAGDFYDFIMGDHGTVGAVIGDVSDKGMGAALFMAVTRSIVRASLTGTDSPTDGITHANHLICSDSSDGMFVSLFYARLDTGTGEVTYVNAGHNPPLLYRADQNNFVELTRTGMILGVSTAHPFTHCAERLAPGSFMLLYTDGLTEARDAQNQLFGEDRMQQILFEHRRAPAAAILAALEQARQAFTGPTAPSDDVTLVLIKRHAASPSDA